MCILAVEAVNSVDLLEIVMETDFFFLEAWIYDSIELGILNREFCEIFCRD